MSSETVVRVSETGTTQIPAELREKHGIDTPSKVRIRESADGALIVEPLGSITEFRGAASGEGETPGTDRLRESRRKDDRFAERLESDG